MTAEKLIFSKPTKDALIWIYSLYLQSQALRNSAMATHID